MILEALESYSDNILLYNESGERRKYVDVLECSSTAAFSGCSRHLVLCIVENSLDGLFGYLALMAAGAVPMMIGGDTTEKRIKEILAIYEPEYIWARSFQLLSYDSFKEVVAIGEYSLFSTPHIGKNLLLPNDLALLLGTSGSTGSPKYVRLSSTNIWSNAKSIATYLQIDEYDRPVTTLPPSYTYGLSIIHSHLISGASIGVTNKTFFDKSFWDFLQASRITTLSGVPYHYEILRRLKLHTKSLTYLKKITQAGGKLDKDLANYLFEYSSKNGIDFYIMYGQTEATARMSYLPPSMLEKKMSSIGVPIPGGEFYLRPLEMSCTGHFEVGELVYKGPNVSLGYANQRNDVYKDDENHGVLLTGDIACVDEEGYYYITGRLSRFIKVHGVRISLDDVERSFQELGFNSVALGSDNSLTIYIESSNRIDLSLVKKEACKLLSVHPTALSVHILSSIPRSASGKILYKQLPAQR